MELYSDTGKTNLEKTDCIGISASPDTLRALAKFFEIAAGELEEMGDDFGHLHLMDHWSGWTEGAPDIQIFNGQI